MDAEHLDPIEAAWACRQRFEAAQRRYYRAVSRDRTLHRGDECRHTGDSEECRAVRAILEERTVFAPLASEMKGWLEYFGHDPKPLWDLVVALVAGTSPQIDEAVWGAQGAIAKLTREFRAKREREKTTLLESMAALAAAALKTPASNPTPPTSSDSTTACPGSGAGVATVADPAPAMVDPTTLYLTEDGRGLRLGSKELIYSKGKESQRVTLRSLEGQLLVASVPPPRAHRWFKKDVVSRLRRALRQTSDGAVRLARQDGGFALIPPLRLAPSLEVEIDRLRRPGATP